MAKRRYKPGQIVWAKVPDRNGIAKETPRPVLVTLVHPTIKDAPLWGIAISTRPEVAQNDPVYELPWDAKTGSTTGLKKWCAAVLLWFVQVPQDAVVEISGSVSREVFKSIEEAVIRAREAKSRRRE